MYKWRNEATLFSRYLGGGVLNTLLGFAAIFLLMGFGVSPILANTGGYAFGLLLGFVVAKKFVFRSNGHFVSETVRYLMAFAIAFLINLTVLELFINLFELNPYISQILAAASYTVAMYVFSRMFVFKVGTP
jgi:putative flippase GtrA